MGRLEIKAGPLVYLAGPITFDLQGSKLWRKRAERCLLEKGVAVFNPREAFSLPEEHLSTVEYLNPVQTINDVAILMSSCVLVHVAHELESAGTEHEMRLCAETQKNVVLWVPWLHAVKAYEYDKGWCSYIDRVAADYGQDFRKVFVARDLFSACEEAARHALVLGLPDVQA